MVADSVILAVFSYCGAMLTVGLMTAFFRVSGLFSNGLLEDKSVGRVVQEYLNNEKRFLVSVSTTYLALTALGISAWARLLAEIPGASGEPRFYLILVVTSVVGWILGGLIFKQVAASTSLASLRAGGLVFFPVYWLLWPWSACLLWVLNHLDDTIWVSEALPHLSPGEIRSALRDDSGDLVLDEDEREMIHSIFHFHDTVVREIMVPRVDVVGLDAGESVAEAVRLVNEARHSRLPVYEGDIDKITGLLYSKDLLSLVGEKGMVAGKVVGDLARPAYFIPESKKIDEVLEELRGRHIHMAVVVDEYGGTAGIVTLEDVLEEIVGEIEDEFDDEQALFLWLDERTLRVDPKIDLEDLQEILGVSLPVVEDCESLGGLILDAAGKVLERGDKVVLAGLTVTVEDTEGQRMSKARIVADEPLPGFVRHST